MSFIDPEAYKFAIKLLANRKIRICSSGYIIYTLLWQITYLYIHFCCYVLIGTKDVLKNVCRKADSKRILYLYPISILSYTPILLYWIWTNKVVTYLSFVTYVWVLGRLCVWDKIEELFRYLSYLIKIKKNAGVGFRR